MLDRAGTGEMREWALPEAYRAEWEARKAASKPLAKFGTGSRGSAIVMTSVLATEDLFFWIEDHPERMRRFRNVLVAKMVERNRALREFSGNTRERSNMI